MGIVGSGGMAEYQVKKFSAIPGCVIVACKDHREDQAADFARRFSIPSSYTRVEDLLDSGTCDAISCAVVDSRHRSIAEAALGRDVPVFCEKPLGRSVADCDALAELARREGVPNLVNFSKRNAGALGALRIALDEGVSGAPLSVEAEYLQGWVATGAWGDWIQTPRWRWRLTPSICTAGVIGDLGSHLADALILVFGGLDGGAKPHVLRLQEAMEGGLVTRRSLPEDFVDHEKAGRTVPVSIETQALLPWGGEAIPLTLRASWVAGEEVDAFRIRVHTSGGALELDLRRSRDSVFFRPQGHGAEREIRGPRLASTYETFLHLVEEGEGSGARESVSKIPDFNHAAAVQRALDGLFPGELPL